MNLESNFEEVMAYARGCVEGSIIANEYRIKGCQRFLNDLENPDYDFKKSDPEFVINMIENTFCHQQGEMFDGTPLRGRPFLLMPFHKFIIYNLLGFKLRGTNINRFHEALIFIPRKNVKTTFAAALAYGLGILYRMSGTKIYVVAAALKQTMETFGFMKYNIMNMGLGDDLRIIDNNNEHSISGEIGGGLFDFNALATNPDAQDSFNCNIAIADEIHAFKKPSNITCSRRP